MSNNRNLKPEALTYLANNSSVRIAHLVKLELATDTEQAKVFIYLTDYSSDVVWNTNTYEAGKVTKIGSVIQGQGIQNYKLTINVAGEFQEELDRGLIENLDFSYVGRDIEVLRAYIDETGAIVPFDIDSDGPMQYFIGDITNIDITEGVTSGESTVKWQCAGKFQDFDAVEGRITDNKSHRGLVVDPNALLEDAATANPTFGLDIGSVGAKAIDHEGDVGFQHSNQAMHVATKYTATETRYKMKKRRFWQTKKLVSYEAEVEKELILGVDLSAQFLPKLYGVRRLPGIPVFIDAVKDDPSQIYVVYAFCEGEVEAFLNLYVDGKSTICNSAKQKDEKVCIGNQAVGDTLSIYSDLASIAEMDNLHDTLVFEQDNEPGGYEPKRVPRVFPTLNKDRTVGTDHGDEITIIDETGVKWCRFYHGLSDQLACSQLVTHSDNENFLNQQDWFDTDVGTKKNPAYSGQPNVAPNILQVVTDYWNDDSRLLDTAYVVLKFAITEEETSLPELEAVIAGSTVSTFDVSEIESVDQYSLNPAWQLLDYMLDPLTGGDMDLSLIDIPSFFKVSEDLDVVTTSYDNSFITYWRYIGWQVEPGALEQKQLMQCNTLLNTENSLTNNIKSLLSQFDGTLNILGGKYHLSIENNDATIADLDIGDVIGSVKTTDLSNKNKWNSIQAAIVDPAQDWNSNQVNFFDSGFLAKDNNVHKKGNIAFSHITNYYTAREWAQRQLAKSRFSREIAFTTYFKYLFLVPNDNVTFTYDRFGYNQKLFRVKTVTLLSNGRVSLVLEDFDSSIYDPDRSNDQSGEIIGPDPIVSPPANLTYDPLPDAGIPINLTGLGNVFGILSWDPKVNEEVLRYDFRLYVEQTLDAGDWIPVGTSDTNIVIGQTTTVNAATKVYHLIQDLTTNINYKFKVRTISPSGKTSKYSVFTLFKANNNLNPEKLSTVTGFETPTAGVDGFFEGSFLVTNWDAHISPLNTQYHLEVRDSFGSIVSREGGLDYYTVSIPTTTFTYDLTKNKADFLFRKGVVGAYRTFKVFIRASRLGAGTVSEWIELI